MTASAGRGRGVMGGTVRAVGIGGSMCRPLRFELSWRFGNGLGGYIGLFRMIRNTSFFGIGTEPALRLTACRIVTGITPKAYSAVLFHGNEVGADFGQGTWRWGIGASSWKSNGMHGQQASL